MKDENGKEVTDKQLIKVCLDHLAECLGLLFETKSFRGHAAAFMTDNLIKYLQVVYRGDDLLSATCDYTKYENAIFQKKQETTNTLLESLTEIRKNEN